MRSVSISSEPIACAIACAAPPVYASAPDSASHSACHAPAARSCSWSSADVRTDAYPATSRAHARASVDVDRVALVRQRGGPAAGPLAQPRRPRSARGARRRARSSRARLRWSRALRRARRSAIRFVCHGSTGSANPRSSASSRRTSSPCSPIAASVPAAPPSCTASRSRRNDSRQARASSTATSQPAALSPNVVGTRLLQQRPRRHRRRPVRLGQPREGGRDARRARRVSGRVLAARRASRRCP